MRTNELADAIFLQIYGDCEYIADDEIDAGDITWSEDKIYPSDEKYVRDKKPLTNVKGSIPMTDNMFYLEWYPTGISPVDINMHQQGNVSCASNA